MPTDYWQKKKSKQKYQMGQRFDSFSEALTWIAKGRSVYWKGRFTHNGFLVSLQFNTIRHSWIEWRKAIPTVMKGENTWQPPRN